ncbi:ComEC/Rec2 family competence protein, partial [Acinetobacter baumannii]
LLLSEPVRKLLVSKQPKGILGRLLIYPVNILAGSAAVMVFTVPLMALHFGTVSLLAPLTNILAMWAVSLCFGGGFIACAASLIYIPLG